MQSSINIGSRATALGACVLAAAGAAFVGILVLTPQPASAITVDAEIVVDAECVRDCLTDLRVCLADARNDFVDCSIESSCVELAAAARLACKADKTASICLEARAEYNVCIAPCRQTLRARVRECRNDSLACLHEECGLTDLPEQCTFSATVK